jgi:hypothetical protein
LIDSDSEVLNGNNKDNNNNGSDICRGNERKIWKQMCNVMWSDKVYVSNRPTDETQGNQINWRNLLKESLMDAKRMSITAEELVQAEWWFRFKWFDPQESGDVAESLGMTFPWKFNSDRTITPADPTIHLSDIPFFQGRIEELEWQILNASGNNNETVSLIAVNNFPKMIVKRAENWGFVMQNAHVIYSSYRLSEYEAESINQDFQLVLTELRRRLGK